MFAHELRDNAARIGEMVTGNAFQAFLAILRNGFIEAFSANFENSPDDGEPVEE